MITDVHTHIYNERNYQSYFSKAGNRVSRILVMACSLWKNFDLGELVDFASTKDNLYVVGDVDVDKDIGKQLEFHQKLFQEKKIFGIKLYPGYQYFYPSDERIYPIAELCQKHNKTLVFHSGDFYDPEGTAMLKY